MNFGGHVKPVLGMIHLRPLPGSPRFQGSLSDVRDHALRDAEALLKGGIRGMIMENFGDSPFYPEEVPPETIAAMTSIAVAIKSLLSSEISFGVNVLRNDGIAALSIAHAASANFVRVNIFAGTRVADQGMISAKAHMIVRHRRRIGAERVQIMADVDVKHSTPIGEYKVESEVKDLSTRSGADALIVSGRGTGEAVNEQDLIAAKAVATLPVYIGSGLNAKTALSVWKHADGAIVGSAFKMGGDPTAPVDTQLVKALLSSLTQS